MRNHILNSFGLRAYVGNKLHFDDYVSKKCQILIKFWKPIWKLTYIWSYMSCCLM